MKQKMEPEPSTCALFRAEPVCKENNACVQYLQQAITRLLMTNETMRFELLAICEKISLVDQAVFGSGSGDIQKRLPLDLVSVLHELCRISEPARHSERTGGEQSSNKVASLPPEIGERFNPKGLWRNR
jgi:hypothetical protein